MVAVPFFLMTAVAPSVMVLLGSKTAETLSRAPVLVENEPPASVGNRFPDLKRMVSAGTPVNRHTVDADVALRSRMSPAWTGMFTEKLLRTVGLSGRGPSNPTTL